MQDMLDLDEEWGRHQDCRECGKELLVLQLLLLLLFEMNECLLDEQRSFMQLEIATEVTQ